MRSTVLLVDDHPLFRDGVVVLLGHEFPRWQLLQAGTLAEAIGHLEHDPDISLVLLDLSLPDSEGLAGLVRLREHAARPRYVVMSSSDSERTVLAAIEHGAAGFIPKTSQAGAMLGALRTVLGGGIFLPPHFAGASMERAAPPAASSADALGLSSRQVDVLRQLAEGKSNKLICRELGISESTVKTHLETIFRKLGATSRTQAVVAAARAGLLRPRVD